ncbi:F420-dependent methylenetetrahydromethanopterin dehydrogenase [archaeon SCG-AAA382B04]|nr:F420-dependent methylenetetrahydromethanopterin dehydrogenase [archaeon SCG-AAA382B04]
MKLGIAKLGHIGSSFVDKLLDERAEREDLDVFCIGSGSKMDPCSSKEVIKKLFETNCDAYIVVSPNPSTPGSREALEKIEEIEEPIVIIGDVAGKEVREDLEKWGFGYIFVYGDALIGARKEFLDPVEMADFNSNVLKVLSLTGVFRKIVSETDRLIDSVKKDSNYLPKDILEPNKIVSEEFENPYARAKARASLEISQNVAILNQKACFKLDNRDEYLPLVVATHEMMEKASELAKEAREIEKTNDNVLRKPHDYDGGFLEKRELFEEFKK